MQMMMMVFFGAIGLLLAACVMALGWLVREVISSLGNRNIPDVSLMMMLFMFSGIMLWALFVILGA